MKVTAVLIVAALGIAGCADPPRLSPLDPQARILAFGNSLTRGVGAGEDESYPAVLSSRIGREVVNAGVPGEVTEAGLKRLPSVLAEVQPRLVILCHGGNDMLRKRSMAAAEENLRQMVRLIRDAGAEVVLVGVPQPGLLLSTADLYERVASQLDIPLDDDTLADLLGDNRFKSDTVHPNREGYALLAQAVEALLRREGAL